MVSRRSLHFLLTALTTHIIATLSFRCTTRRFNSVRAHSIHKSLLRRFSSSVAVHATLSMDDKNNNNNVTPHISISDAFDGGNGVYEKMEYDREWNIYVNIRPDPFTLYERKHHSQYFSFRSTVSSIPGPTTIRYVLANAGQASFPQAWKDSTTFVSTTPFDPFSWTRKLDTVYDEETATLSWTHTHEPHSGYTEEESTSSSRENGKRSSSSSSSVYFAYFPPYSYQRHLNLLARISSLATTSSSFSSNVAVYSLGQTLDGREIDCIQMGHGSRIAWIIHRQHPGETMAEFYAEGLLQRLIGLDNREGGHEDAWMDTTTTTFTPPPLDPVTQQALNLYTFYIVPNMNLDGSVKGYLRTNAGGQNLNREWTRSSFTKEGDSTNSMIPYEAPTLERSPEVYHVLNKIQQTGVDVFFDVHGDEDLPFNFVSGAEGCSTWSPRMEALQGAFLGAYCRANSDMQKQVSYDPELPGQARINVASNYIATAYDCLALTLEMPFKDCLTHRDPIYGWSPARCKRLGASVVDALIHVHPILRDYDTEFWKKLDQDDVYIRPSSNYEHL